MTSHAVTSLFASRWELIRGVLVVESLRTPAGRPFQPVAEADIVPQLYKLVKELTRGPGLIMAIPEFVGPFGVADLVAIETSEDRLIARAMAAISPLLNEVDAGIVSVLRRREGRALDEISQALQWTHETVARRLPGLVRRGAIRERNGKFIRHPDLTSLGRLHAIEAKVSDWRRGVLQARTYALWADSSTVALGRAPVEVSALRAEAARWGTGVAVGANWLRRPKGPSLQKTRRLWASEHAVAAILRPAL